VIGCCTGIKASAQHYSWPLESVTLNIGKIKSCGALFNQVIFWAMEIMKQQLN